MTARGLDRGLVGSGHHPDDGDHGHLLDESAHLSDKPAGTGSLPALAAAATHTGGVTELGDQFSTAGYNVLRTRRPELFAKGGPGSIEILEPDAQTSEDGQQFGVMYADQYVTLLRDRVRFPGGVEGAYIRVIPSSPSPGVVVLPVVSGHILLLHQFRHATRSWHWELPRGFRDDDDASPQDTATRELREETGAEATRLVMLGRMHTNTGMTSECVDLVFAEAGEVGTPAYAEGISQVRTVATAELEAMLLAGEVTDAFTIAAYTQARLRGLI